MSDNRLRTYEFLWSSVQFYLGPRNRSVPVVTCRVMHPFVFIYLLYLFIYLFMFFILLLVVVLFCF